MYKKKNIQVLIVDDSVVSQQMIARGISQDAAIEVVAVASDPFDAKEKIGPNPETYIQNYKI